MKSFLLKLLGAQAKNGCLFITMPEHPKFGSLSDRDAEKIFKYLVGLARYLGIVFNFFRKEVTVDSVSQVCYSVHSS